MNERGRPPAQENGDAGAVRRSIDGERLIAMFTQLVEPLGQSLPISSEVVLHDLSLLPDSIVAVHGNVTGRRVGDPATDLLLEKMSDSSGDQMVGYVTTLADGRRVRSCTMIIRDVSGLPVAALCINSDLSVWVSVQQLAEVMLKSQDLSEAAAIEAMPPMGSEGQDPSPEVFARNVDELAAHLIHRAVAKQSIPVELMQKRHKLTVVRELKAKGMFLLRDAVDMIASSLSVSRFTIYNYLNEITDEDKHEVKGSMNSLQAESAISEIGEK